MGSSGLNFVLQDGDTNQFYYELAFLVGNEV